MLLNVTAYINGNQRNSLCSWKNHITNTNVLEQEPFGYGKTLTIYFNERCGLRPTMAPTMAPTIARTRAPLVPLRHLQEHHDRHSRAPITVPTQEQHTGTPSRAPPRAPALATNQYLQRIRQCCVRMVYRQKCRGNQIWTNQYLGCKSNYRYEQFI